MSEWEIPNEFSMPSGIQLPQLTGEAVNLISMDAPGPVGEAYMYGMKPIEFIMGPVGSAKTTCSVFRILAFALRMPPCKDGVIRVRGCVVHENLRDLYKTAVPSLQQFFKPGAPGVHWSGGQDRPLQIVLRFLTPKGREIQIIIDGFGITKDTMEGRMRGYQINFGWCTEADLLDGEVPSFIYSRVAQGRYPGRAMLADPNAEIPGSVWGDLNAPLISNYVYSDFIEKPRPGYKLHRQPSGLAENAENRRYVTRESYVSLAETLPADKKRRMVDAEFGLVGDGALVYPGYNHAIHCSREIMQPLDLPLRLGFDGGGTPALIVSQYTPTGRMLWLSELTTDPGTGAGRFTEYVVDHLQAKYRGLPVLMGWCDPSAFHGVDRTAGELAMPEMVGKALGVPILPTDSNDPSMRQESVDWFIRRGLDDQGLPYFQHCKSMKLITRGFQGGFVMDKNRHDTTDRIAFRKNAVSHPHEAGQYVCYGSRGHAGIINDAARAGRPGNVVPISSGRGPSREFNL
ncbi:hypothetical protein [Tardiphaga sp.]|jgi:hypothetical protein|uniref:hypothetical protein n=1 Tax=Tardiphaga sp. TaxID=1926292 RepID=UPI0037D9F289